jgi:hypothetical protein
VRPPVAKRPSLFEAPRAAYLSVAASSLGTVTLAFIGAFGLAAIKWLVQERGWEVPGLSLGVLTALLGAVVFTLAIVFAGVLADFKEAERGLGELVSAVRRLHWDFALSGMDPQGVALARAKLSAFVDMVLENARHGFRWRLRDLHGPLDDLDRLLLERMKAPWPTTRTTEVGLATLTRIVDRLETIVETTFMRAGYLFSASAISLLLACLLLTPLGGGGAGAALYGTAGFVLVGLYLIVRDLDNPLAGSVRISVTQVEKLALFLRERERQEPGHHLGPGLAAPAPALAVEAKR